ncbi:MAG: DNA methyltransferase [Pirellulaceae bacterium]
MAKTAATIVRRAIAIDAIDVGNRTRKDMGDLAALASSIEEIGLLQPVVIDSENKLVAGRRRIEACKRLGWKEVPVVFATSVDSLFKLAQAESDENTCRKDFTPEEAVRMGERIEKVAVDLAKAAQKKAAAEGGKTAGRGRPKDDSHGETFPKANRDESKRTRARVASTVGMSDRQFEKAKTVVHSGNEQALAQMNKTGKVDPAFRAVKREEKKTAMRKKAAEIASAPDKPEKPKWNIILGDSFKELSKIKNARLIVADPPYNQGVNYGEDFDDEIDEDEYLRWSRQWINLCSGALAADGSLWVIISDEWAEHLAIMLGDAGLHRRAWIKWFETFGVNCTNNFNRCSRHIFYYVVDPKRFVFNAESRYIRRPSDRQAKYNDQRADPDGKLWDDVWTIPRLVDNAEERIPDFPTQIPLAITRAIVACASEPGDLVVDPFCGSASTGHAALELHRRFTGIEIGEQFWELATVRLAGVTPFAPDAL